MKHYVVNSSLKGYTFSLYAAKLTEHHKDHEKKHSLLGSRLKYFIRKTTAVRNKQPYATQRTVPTQAFDVDAASSK